MVSSEDTVSLDSKEGSSRSGREGKDETDGRDGEEGERDSVFQESLEEGKLHLHLWPH